MALHSKWIGVVLALVCFGAAVPAGAEPTNEQRAAESRALIMSFAKRLKAELVGAIKAGGPESAIPVCHTAAPEIAKEKSEEKGWSVGRTALKLRNPSNAPDPWERSVLVKFEEKLGQGADVATLEHYETTEEDGRRVFRYMKAIPTQKPCLTCHGPNVSASLKRADHRHLSPGSGDRIRTRAIARSLHDRSAA